MIFPIKSIHPMDPGPDHRSCTVTAPVTAPVAGATAGAAADATETETTETSVALGSSPARP